MDTLDDYIREYTIQLGKGKIQKAYKGIITFMTELKAYLERKYPDYTIGALYSGYMDMTYLAFTPSDFKTKKLKVAIVFLHEECKFELWLAGTNRKIQADFIELLSRKNIGRYTLSRVSPGVDSIIASLIVEQPCFDNPYELMKQIEGMTLDFINDMDLYVK